jgi:hypothetical protein
MMLLFGGKVFHRFIFMLLVLITELLFVRVSSVQRTELVFI